ncbi:hypothetical protein [Streptomyces atacamensis]|uniref:hypothetical protein n=1 Tax=Streptomyces atacamensis TaxID=531966 RepID=UPI00399C734E
MAAGWLTTTEAAGAALPVKEPVHAASVAVRLQQQVQVLQRPVNVPARAHGCQNPLQGLVVAQLPVEQLGTEQLQVLTDVCHGVRSANGRLVEAVPHASSL